VVLSALASNGEVIVSRGELIEIGDGFRIPEVMAQSGAILREVGTTNRTRTEDYERAITDKTKLLLRVHPSNFQISGFTEKPSVAELVALSRGTNLPLVEDLGSGCLVDLSEYCIHEPTVRQSIEAGISLVTFSGDKLLGGPQAGIIAGKQEFVQRVRRHPLFRALRVDKLTITALEVTLAAYQRGALDEVPTLAMIRMSNHEMERRSRNFVRELTPSLSMSELDLEIADGESLAGGGSTPEQWLPTKVIRIKSRRYFRFAIGTASSSRANTHTGNSALGRRSPGDRSAYRFRGAGISARGSSRRRAALNACDCNRCALHEML